ncbi:hypothetical protein DTO166G4_947 [Paecilomyces variotii]|nr:hypothetical protein DTO166G4_947 [Paecilomyces variotii]KAJ9231747.1 hypothetical protein DTO166G5_6628 [Paecilomyces variotii]KAJ9258602.1 hypothetical protein DTO195F2_5255 [Paecilomyces variotii]KAJ9309498.1 hypothetical protein DTO217A2_1116 [Paecilomyces variotii]
MERDLLSWKLAQYCQARDVVSFLYHQDLVNSIYILSFLIRTYCLVVTVRSRYRSNIIYIDTIKKLYPTPRRIPS